MSHVILDSHRTTRTTRLRAVLGVNASTSLLAGSAAAIAPTAVGDLLGLGDGSGVGLIVRIVGVGLALFAIDVALVARRSSDGALRRHAQLVAAADVAWVVATVAVVGLVDMSALGRVLAVGQGIGVSTFAALQLRLR